MCSFQNESSSFQSDRVSPSDREETDFHREDATPTRTSDREETDFHREDATPTATSDREETDFHREDATPTATSDREETDFHREDYHRRTVSSRRRTVSFEKFLRFDLALHREDGRSQCRSSSDIHLRLETFFVLRVIPTVASRREDGIPSQ